MVRLTGLRHSAIAVIAVVVVGLTCAASAAALSPLPPPRATLEAGGVTFEPMGGFGCGSYPTSDADPSVPVPKLCGDPGPDEKGYAVPAAAFPFTALLHFSVPPAAVTARIGGTGEAVPVTQVDADSWALTLPTAVPDGTKVWFSASGGVGEFYNVFHLVVPLPPAPQPLPPAPQPLPPPRAEQPQPRPQITLLATRRRGTALVVRLRANVAGRLDGGVRQAGHVRRFSVASVSAGVSRFELVVPRARTRAATVTLRLTDAAGRSARLSRTVR